jgi:parallel beta-helix repeat protein
MILLLISSPAVLSSAVIHVPGDQPTIQAGIDAASSGDTVLVADGTYTGPGNRDLNPGGKAITVRSKNGPAACIIDCEGAASAHHRGFYVNSGEQKNTVISGFTIRNGWAASGGGIYCAGASPVITGNKITGNRADHHGGGVYCENSDLTLSHNTISGNESGLNGGGVFCYEASAPQIAGNIISRNKAEFSGGGVSCFWSASPAVFDNTIEANRAGEYGGGLDCYQSSPELDRNTVIGNVSDYDGGGIYHCACSSPRIAHTTLANNTPNQIYGDAAPGLIHHADTSQENLKEDGLHTVLLYISGPADPVFNTLKDSE